MIMILTSGGTIAGLDCDNETDAHTKTSKPISEFLIPAQLAFPYTVKEVFAKDSRAITARDLQQLVLYIRSAPGERILITHGTYTLVETACFLGACKLDKTIVLTGAFVLGTEADTDAPFNLGYALCALQNLERGVYVAMHGRIFSWDNITKNTITNRFEPLTPTTS